MQRLGYIGLGRMGKSMARNLLRAGYDLTVHNRSRESAQELAAEGAKIAETPSEVAQACDVLFTNLPDSADVEQVTLGPGGVIEGCRTGMITVDHSTIRPETARRIAQELARRGVVALDAPVSGGDIGARERTLSIMVGGPKEALEAVRPILGAVGKTIIHVGESGAGQVAKACNQIMVGAQMVAMGELMLLAQMSGVDPRKVIEAIRDGAARCWTLDVKPQRLFAGERAPGFRSRLMHKDLAIALDAGRSCGAPLPATATVAQLFQAMLPMGMGEQDNSAVIGVLEALAGTRLIERAGDPELVS